MAYTEFTVEIDAASRERAAEALLEEGISFEERDQTTLLRPPAGRLLLIAYSEPPRAEGDRSRIHACLQRAGIDAPVLRRDSDDESWRDAWKAYFHPRAVGPFVIAPSWEPCTPAAGEIVITLDPGRAFGTGGHASTRTCLRAIGALALDPGLTPSRVLDVGCGSGLLALACLLRWPGASAVAIDIDPEAAETTRENAVVNGVPQRIAVSTTPLDAVPGGFDLVLANITAETLAELAPGLAGHLAPGGRLITGGILVEQADEVARRFAARGLALVDRLDEEDWTALTFSHAASHATSHATQRGGA